MNHTNLFKPETTEHFVSRVHKLTAHSKPQWGKMNIAQMLAHTSIVLEKAMSKEKEPRKLISYILGPLFKHLITNSKPYKTGLPTSPNFITTEEEKDFEQKKHACSKQSINFRKVARLTFLLMPILFLVR